MNRNIWKWYLTADLGSHWFCSSRSMGLSHGINHFVDYEVANAQLALVSESTDQSSFLAGVTSSVGSLAGDIVSKCFLCKDPQGWGPVSESQFSLTPCFVDGVVLNFPNLLLLTLGSYQVHQLLKQKPMSTRWDWKFVTKLTLVSIQIVLYLIAAYYSLLSSSDPLQDIAVLSPIISVVSLGVAFSLHVIENSRTNIPNGVLLFYWLLSPVMLVFKIYDLYISDSFADPHTRTYSVLFVLAAINGINILFVERLFHRYRYSCDVLLDELEQKSPEEKADIFAQLTFTWMTPLMKQGYKAYLTEEDLPPLPASNATTKTADKFEKYWNREVQKKTNPSLTKALARAFGGTFMVGGVFKAIQDILSFTQPQLLRLLIQFVNDYNSSEAGTVPLSKGFAIAAAMFIVSVMQTIALHQYFQRAFGTGMRLKSSLTSAIFKKSLVLSNEDRSQKSTGDIVNLMSVDTQRLQDLCQYGQTIWSGPFQIILCLVSLYNILGNSMWAGVAVMVIMIPINSYLANIQKELQKRQMKNKDQRTRLTSEILTNVKSLKLYGWELPFISKLNHVRNDLELVTLKEIGLFSAATSFLWNCAPFFVSCSTFALFVFTQDRPLTTDIVFPALTLFNLLSFPLAVIPMVVSAMVEASVAIGRLTSFLTSEELQPDAVDRLPRANQMGEEAVMVKAGTFLWERKPEYKIALANINFSAKKGELACVVGRVGAGKSSLLQAILGDLYKAEGHVTVKGKVAYVAQVPWIMNATVKENILFGCKFDPEFYQKTVEACALTDDFAILPKGDETQVGEKGISLSGGQKARLSLARSVYARADVYLLDDPLSAVDEHVGRHIIDNVLGPEGLLASKSIVLATNSIPVLSQADTITMLSAGRIVESGELAEVMSTKGAIYSLISDFGKKPRATVSDASSRTALEEGSSEPSSAVPSAAPSELNLTHILDKKRRRESTHTLRRASIASFTKPSIDDEDGDKEENKEHSEQGKVKWDVYIEYAKASNIFGVLTFLVMLLVSTGLSVGGNVWLKHWSEVNTGSHTNPHVGMYLGIYAAFGIGSAFLMLIQTVVLMIYCAIHSAKKLHDGMLNAVIRAPMSFFETTPLGRIINRFSNDVYRVDQILARTFSQFFANSVKVLYTLLVITFSTPQFLLFVVPLGALYVYYQRYYLRTSRELKRLDSVSKSPIYAHFQETLGGISTVRAYDQQTRFSFINESRLDINLKAYYPTISANRWLAVRLEFIGSFIILAAAGLGIGTLPTGRLTAGIIGLAMSYALQITQSLNWIVRMTVEVETNIVSVERILEYSRLDSEAPEVIENNRPAATWPTEGAVVFNDYSVRYRPGLPLVLKNINLDIKPREKIGIVGRTGAGKSSLTLALFRIIEAAGGHIDIDSVDTSLIGLRDLRHRLSIIPQDSQAFEGTIRDNIDPEGVHDDTELWRVLELSHLKTHVQAMSDGLESKVNEGGSNLSVGQRQLMCLARALLTPSKVLVLDEATAAVDVETDHVIQETIRNEFNDRTILTIAHRLNTIMDSDRIVVLSAGEVAEFDSPEKLLQNKDSMFFSLCKQGGFVEE
ncbi:ATP-binding cassette glutathione S-conjugate transporter YCF1 [Sugiyamaella lignohabitans]|uniref:ATP-binding cassette glutathione S-conjugate transporter YCF1 n=1 Tax=Sugiyamaella lignohabitans TaxID=796027 RepID=A0A170QYS1_9ASCO|nr:ATP-binding cassette glutathione S-conjugate transporter YCF1 [Sugiyamaella lignohabitans]ANB15991.1 ATP-binding cassette glutathione S-conjugate transporter YCF1 [Sugiyamaella lignohabitans]